jgi:hypothetical protein
MCAKVYYVNFNIEEINEINFSLKIQEEIDNLAKLTYCLRNQPESVRFKALGIAIKAKGYGYHRDMIKRWKTIHAAMKIIIDNGELEDFEEKYLSPALKILKQQLPALLRREFHNRLSLHIKKQIRDVEYEIERMENESKIIEWDFKEGEYQQILSLSDTNFIEFENQYLLPQIKNFSPTLVQLLPLVGPPNIEQKRLKKYNPDELIEIFLQIVVDKKFDMVSRLKLAELTQISQATWSRTFKKLPLVKKIKDNLDALIDKKLDDKDRLIKIKDEVELILEKLEFPRLRDKSLNQQEVFKRVYGTTESDETESDKTESDETESDENY